MKYWDMMWLHDFDVSGCPVRGPNGAVWGLRDTYYAREYVLLKSLRNASYSYQVLPTHAHAMTPGQRFCS
jgi:hypothetical protein